MISFIAVLPGGKRIPREGRGRTSPSGTGTSGSTARQGGIFVWDLLKPFVRWSSTQRRRREVCRAPIDDCVGEVEVPDTLLWVCARLSNATAFAPAVNGQSHNQCEQDECSDSNSGSGQMEFEDMHTRRCLNLGGFLDRRRGRRFAVAHSCRERETFGMDKAQVRSSVEVNAFRKPSAASRCVSVFFRALHFSAHDLDRA